MWTARLTVVGTTTAVMLAVVGVLAGVEGGAEAAASGIVATIALMSGVTLLLRGRYRSWGYAERGDDLLVRRGVMFRRLTIVPYGRMQFVDVTAGPVDRMFGLATVQLHTAAAATDARIPGLSREVADRLRDRLAALGEARAAGL
jgi:membrane protein YdbS with pleckstrin-like domain